MKRFSKMNNKILSAVLCLGLLSGCSLSLNESNARDPSPGKTSPTKSNAAKPGTTGALTGSDPVLTQPVESFPAEAKVARRILGTIHTLNPHQIKLSSEEDLAIYIFGALYIAAGDQATGNLKFIPYQAMEEPINLDSKNYTIRIKAGLQWSDGAPITAQDYVASMKLLLDPALNNPLADRFATDLGLVNARDYNQGRLADFSQVGFTAADDQTLKITLERPMVSLDVISLLTTPFLVNAAIYERLLNADKTTTSYGNDFKELVYAGPYEIEDYVAGQYLRLKRQASTPLDPLNQVYYTADYISQRTLSDKTTALEEFLKGTLDVVPISGRAYQEFKNDPRVMITASNTVWGMYVNTNNPQAEILKNTDFRKALYYGVDRTAIAVTMFGSYSSYSGFIGPQSLVGEFDSFVKYRKTSRGKQSVPAANVFNLKTARKYAETAIKEVTDPQVIEITIPSGDAQLQEMAEFLKTAWEDLFGIDQVTFTIKPLPLAQAYDTYRSRDYDLGFGGMGQELYNPWRTLAVFSSSYPAKLDTMADAGFDLLWLNEMNDPLKNDLQSRLDALQEMEDILLDQLPQIPLFINNNAYLVSDRITLPFKEAVPGYGLGLDMAQYE